MNPAFSDIDAIIAQHYTSYGVVVAHLGEREFDIQIPAVLTALDNLVGDIVERVPNLYNVSIECAENTCLALNIPTYAVTESLLSSIEKLCIKYDYTADLRGKGKRLIKIPPYSNNIHKCICELRMDFPPITSIDIFSTDTSMLVIYTADEVPTTKVVVPTYYILAGLYILGVVGYAAAYLSGRIGFGGV